MAMVSATGKKETASLVLVTLLLLLLLLTALVCRSSSDAVETGDALVASSALACISELRPPAAATATAS